MFSFFTSSELCSERGEGVDISVCDVGIGMGRRRWCEGFTIYVTL